MRKSAPHNNNVKKTTSNLLQETYDIFNLRSKPLSIDFIENLGQLAYKSALEVKDDITIYGFFAERGHNKDDVTRWSKRSETFEKLMQLRKELILHKIKAGHMLRDAGKKYLRINEGSGARYLIKNDDEWRRFREWESNLNKEQQPPERTVIVMDSFQDKPKEIGEK
jgi:hypothetical protein